MNKIFSKHLLDISIAIAAGLAASITVYVTDIKGLEPFDVAFLSVLFVSLFLIPFISYAKKRKTDDQALILSKIQEVTYESVAILSFMKSGQEVNYWPHLNKIADSISKLFSTLTDHNIQCGIFSIENSDSVKELLAYKLATSQSGDFARDTKTHPINVNTVFHTIIEGGRYYLSNNIRQEKAFETTNERMVMENRSVMAFPISIFTKTDDVTYQRTFLGFLVLESQEKHAFNRHNPKHLENDVLYRAGASMADILSLVLSMRKES